MFNFFRKSANLNYIDTDIHSHLIPGIDDGVKTFDQSIEILRGLSHLGTSQVITTPHIMSDLYPNDEKNILNLCNELRIKLEKAGIPIQIKAAAEYYLDETLIDKLNKTPEQLLTFGKEYLLFETSFLNKPLYLNEFIFEAKSAGLKPVLAHPERYGYLQADKSLVDDLIDRGVLLQLNIISLAGFYSKAVRRFAEKLIQEKKIHFIGSDCHNIHHFNAIKQAMNNKYYRQVLNFPLLNHEI